MHREEFLEMNPSDAAVLSIGQNMPVVVSSGSVELTLSAALTDAVAAGSVFLPRLYDGGRRESAAACRWLADGGYSPSRLSRWPAKIEQRSQIEEAHSWRHH